MNADEFVDAIFFNVYASASEGVIRVIDSPPGRSPRADLVQLSKWYHSLDLDSLVQVRRLIRFAADSATFGMLAVMDGVRPISNEPITIALTVDGLQVNESGDLHEIFRSLSDEAEYGLEA
jgi:hypothetical protein